MNPLEKNKRENELRSMYHQYNLEDVVINLLRPFVTGIINDEIRYNKYLNFHKTVKNRFNSGKVWYYSNSLTIQVNREYLPQFTYINDVAKVSWYCTLNRDSSITVSIKIYNGHIHGHQQFSESFELEDLFYQKKKWFKMRTFVNTDLIGNTMVNFDTKIQDAIENAITGMLRDLECTK
jgi:hypothetical protein